MLFDIYFLPSPIFRTENATPGCGVTNDIIFHNACLDVSTTAEFKFYLRHVIYWITLFQLIKINNSSENFKATESPCSEIKHATRISQHKLRNASARHFLSVSRSSSQSVFSLQESIPCYTNNTRVRTHSCAEYRTQKSVNLHDIYTYIYVMLRVTSSLKSSRIYRCDLYLKQGLYMTNKYQNPLSSRPLSKNLEIKTHRTVVP